MKKEQENKIDFNPADYDYLENAPLQDYISEILSRNNEFLNDCNLVTSNIEGNVYKDRLDFYKKYKVYIPLFFKDEDVKRFQESEKKQIFLNASVKTFRIISEREPLKSDTYKELSNKSEKYFKKNNYKYALWCNRNDFDINVNHSYEILEILLGAADEKGYWHIPDTLLLSINLDLPKERILSDIEKILAINKEKKKSKLRLDKWKYYLIVFDLRKQGLGYNKISDQLMSAYPTDNNLFDERNIENYYGNALKLINGEYKKYC